MPSHSTTSGNPYDALGPSRNDPLVRKNFEEIMSINPKLVDISGMFDNTPVCPKHEEVCLLLEQRTSVRGDYAIWRCPVDDRLYSDPACLI